MSYASNLCLGQNTSFLGRLGVNFYHFGVLIKVLQYQTMKDILGVLNQVVVPTPRIGANGPL